MSRVKRVWREGESPVLLCILALSDQGVGLAFQCPQCGADSETWGPTVIRRVQCSCGVHLRLTIKATLEELEEEEVKGE